jgi:hypothetical protein
VLTLQTKTAAALSSQPQTAAQLAAAIGSQSDSETVFCLLEHLAANGRAKRMSGIGPTTAAFCAAG